MAGANLTDSTSSGITSSNTSSGGGGGIWGAVGQLASSLVTNIFGAKQKRLNAEYQRASSTLNSQQMYALNLQLAQAKSDNEKLAIITNATSGIYQTGVEQSVNAATKQAMIFIGGAMVLFTAIYFMKKTE